MPLSSHAIILEYMHMYAKRQLCYLFRQTYWFSAHRVYSPLNVPPYLPGALPAKAHYLLPVRNSTEVVVVT